MLLLYLLTINHVKYNNANKIIYCIVIFQSIFYVLQFIGGNARKSNISTVCLSYFPASTQWKTEDKQRKNDVGWKLGFDTDALRGSSDSFVVKFLVSMMFVSKRLY